MRYTITDQLDANRTVTVEDHDVTDTIRGWFEDPPERVVAVLGDLQDALITRDPEWRDLAEYLGIEVREAH